MRRSVLNPFFSKRSITEQSGIIESAVEKLCQRIEEFRTSQAPLDLRTIYSALTADVISKYSYGWSYDCLSKPDFDKQMFIEMSSSGELGLLLKHFPWIATAGNMMPLRLVEWLNPQIMALVNRRIVIDASFPIVPHMKLPHRSLIIHVSPCILSSTANSLAEAPTKSLRAGNRTECQNHLGR